MDYIWSMHFSNIAHISLCPLALHVHCAMCISVQLHCGVTVNEYGYWLCTLLGTTDGTVLRVLCRGTVSQYFQHFFIKKLLLVFGPI